MENSEVPENSQQIQENLEIKKEKRKSQLKIQRLKLNKNLLLQRPKVEADLKGVLTPSHASSEFP